MLGFHTLALFCPIFSVTLGLELLLRNLVCMSQVIGLNNVLIAGDEFEVVASLDVARQKAEACAELLRNKRMSAKAGDGKVTLSSLASAASAGKLSGLDLHQLNIILKVDLQVCTSDLHKEKQHARLSHS